MIKLKPIIRYGEGAVGRETGNDSQPDSTETRLVLGKLASPEPLSTHSNAIPRFDRDWVGETLPSLN